MKVILLDISGKVVNYDLALFEALNKESEYISIEYYIPSHGLLSLIPKKWQSSLNIGKRVVKVVEGLLNYAFTCVKVACSKPDVLHMQWLPFMEFVGWEFTILKCLRWLSPKTRLVLTIHNVYPHDMDDVRKRSYNERFRKACSLIDAFIVHTKISKEDVIREFGLSAEKVHVCCHGVFEPKGITISSDFRKDGKLHILQFGGQSYYKGTDLLVDAVCKLDEERKKRLETHIVGGISQSFLTELKAKDIDSIITWKAYFLTDEELYQEMLSDEGIKYDNECVADELLLDLFEVE